MPDYKPKGPKEHHRALVYCQIAIQQEREGVHAVCKGEEGNEYEYTTRMDCVLCAFRIKEEEEVCDECDSEDIKYEELEWKKYKGTCNKCGYTWEIEFERKVY